MVAINGALGKVIAGAIITTAIGITGTGIVYNRNDAIKEFKAVRSEMAYGDTMVLIKVDKVEDIVTDIRLEQRTMTETLKRIEQKR